MAGAPGKSPPENDRALRSDILHLKWRMTFGGGTSTGVGGADAATILPPLGRRPRRREVGEEAVAVGVLVIYGRFSLPAFKHFLSSRF